MPPARQSARLEDAHRRRVFADAVKAEEIKRKQFPFLELPAEIRAQIYDYVVEDRQVVIHVRENRFVEAKKLSDKEYVQKMELLGKPVADPSEHLNLLREPRVVQDLPSPYEARFRYDCALSQSNRQIRNEILPLFHAPRTIYLDCQGLTAKNYLCDLTTSERASITHLCFPKRMWPVSAHDIIMQVTKSHSGFNRLVCITLWAGFKVKTRRPNSLAYRIRRSQISSLVLWYIHSNPEFYHTRDHSTSETGMEDICRRVFSGRFGPIMSVVDYARHSGPPWCATIQRSGLKASHKRLMITLGTEGRQ